MGGKNSVFSKGIYLGTLKLVLTKILVKIIQVFHGKIDGTEKP